MRFISGPNDKESTMDGISPGLLYKLDRFLFLLSMKLGTGKKVQIIGHPGCDLDLLASFQFTGTLCWLLGATSVEYVHILRDGETEDPRLTNLGVRPLGNLHFKEDPNLVRILVDCSDLSFVFGVTSGFPTVDFVIDHHEPSPELAVSRASYLILPKFGCAALIAFLLLRRLHSTELTVEGVNLMLSAFAVDLDLGAVDLLDDQYRHPVVDLSVFNYCAGLYRTFAAREEVSLFDTLVEKPWRTPEFNQALHYAMSNCERVLAPELGSLLEGDDLINGPKACWLNSVQLFDLPASAWVGKLAGMLLRMTPAGIIGASVVRAPVGDRMITSVRTNDVRLSAGRVVRRLEDGCGGGNLIAAGCSRPRWLAVGLLNFLRKED